MRSGISKKVLVRSAVLDAIRRGVYPIGSKMACERDLSAQLGVSRVIVGNVLRDLAGEGWLERRVGSGTYVSNRRAMPARESRIRNIGLVMRYKTNPVVSRLMEGIHRVLPAEECNLLLKDHVGDPGKEMKYVEHLLGSGVDGLVVSTSFPFESVDGLKFYRAVLDRNPLVMTDCVLKGDIPTIEVENVRGGALAAEYLLGGRPGAKKFWLLKGGEGLSTVEERVQGFLMETAARSAVTVSVAAHSDDADACRQAVVGLAGKGLPDGIFLTNEMGIVPMFRAFSELGIERNEIALCCFDNFSSLPSLYGLAHVEQPLVEVGMEIARYLLLQHDSRNEPVKKLKLVPRLVPPEEAESFIMAKMDRLILYAGK